jgi:hypothetical protein
MPSTTTSLVLGSATPVDFETSVVTPPERS